MQFPYLFFYNKHAYKFERAVTQIIMERKLDKKVVSLVYTRSPYIGSLPVHQRVVGYFS